MEDQNIVIEKRLSLLANKYGIVSDTIKVTDNTIKVRLQPKNGLPYTLKANL